MGTRTNLALDLCDPSRSLKYAERWEELEEENYVKTTVMTPQLAASKNSMGVALASCERFDDVRKYLLDSKRIRESLEGFKPSHNFSPLLALGVSSYLEGSNLESLKYLKDALRDREADFGPGDKEGMRYVRPDPLRNILIT